MKPLYDQKIQKHAVPCPQRGMPIIGDGGAYRFGDLYVIASVGDGWDHVSVSRADRIPSWTEMEKIRKIFFKKNEVVVQYHVPVELHINQHPYCLHMWRPQEQQVPMPPIYMV